MTVQGFVRKTKKTPGELIYHSSLASDTNGIGNNVWHCWKIYFYNDTHIHTQNKNKTNGGKLVAENGIMPANRNAQDYDSMIACMHE